MSESEVEPGRIEELTNKINELENKIHELESKKKTKSVDEPAECGVCHMILKNKYILKTHMKNRHDDNREKFKCSICGKELKSKYYLSTHLKNKHSDST